MAESDHPAYSDDDAVVAVAALVVSFFTGELTK